MLFRLVDLESSSLEANLGSLGSVVGRGHFLEPRVIQGLLGCDPVGRVIDEDLPQQVEEILEERRVRRDDILLCVSTAAAYFSSGK